MSNDAASFIKLLTVFSMNIFKDTKYALIILAFVLYMDAFLTLSGSINFVSILTTKSELNQSIIADLIFGGFLFVLLVSFPLQLASLLVNSIWHNFYKSNYIKSTQLNIQISSQPYNHVEAKDLKREADRTENKYMLDIYLHAKKEWDEIKESCQFDKQLLVLLIGVIFFNFIIGQYHKNVFTILTWLIDSTFGQSCIIFIIFFIIYFYHILSRFDLMEKNWIEFQPLYEKQMTQAKENKDNIL